MSDSQRERPPAVGDAVAFYGSLMRGLGALDALPSRDALRYVEPCQIQGELYDLGPYPGLRESPPSETSDHHLSAPQIVQAELHAILDTRVIEDLDFFEGYEPAEPENSLYLRKRVSLLSPTDSTPTENWAWVYFYNHTPSPAERVDSGDWRAHLLMRDARLD